MSLVFDFGQGWSGLGVRVKVRACDVVCPLDTVAVTELWRLDLFSCTSSSFLCAGMLSSRGKCFFFFFFFFRGRFSLPACRRLLFPSLHARGKGTTSLFRVQQRKYETSARRQGLVGIVDKHLFQRVSLVTSMTLPLNSIFVLLLPYFTRPALNNCFELENLIVTQTIVLHNMANEGNEMSAMQLFQHIYPWNRHWYNLDQSELIE